MTKAAAHAKYASCGSFCSLVCAECGHPLSGLSQSDAESVFFAPKLYTDTASGQKKRLKEQKQSMIKAATYARKRELRFSFCSLVCAEWGSPYFAGTVCQMFFAYSFTALSAANLPEQAVFISDIEFQRVLSAQSSSILFCAWR